VQNPPRPPRGPAEGWVELDDGRRFWGRVGAAGLLVVSPTGSVLLQHRVGWSHHGGTWGLPGGAREPGESAVEGAAREAREETALDTAALRPLFTSVLDLEVWSYTTVAAEAPEELPVSVSDAESEALAWVPADEVDARPLHPGFAAAWPRLREHLAARPALVVDAANVVGSRPDGWWRDRRGAAERLLAGLAMLAEQGIDAEAAEEEEAGHRPPVSVAHWWPEIVAVLEGAARGAAAPGGVRVVEAPADGDAAVAEQTAGLVAAGRTAWVVTADRELAERVRAAGGEVRGPGWLLSRLPPAEPVPTLG
jgi:8-oxo-dGTP pyrophosphatase MutT (NUDIX family)